MSDEADAPYCGDLFPGNDACSLQCFSCGGIRPRSPSLWMCAECSYQECHGCHEHFCKGNYWIVLAI